MRLDADNKARLAFALALLLCAVGGVAWYCITTGRYAIYEIRASDAVSGLIVDAPVEYHGVDVGRVKRVELVDSRSVRVLLSVERTAPVSAATVATITTRGLADRGLTRYVYVALEDTSSDSGSLVAGPGQDYPAIPMAPSKSASLDTAITRMDENMQRITERLNDVLDPGTIASLKQTVGDLQRVTKTLADNNGKLNTLIVNSERVSRQIEPLLASSNDTLNTLQTQILPDTHRALTSLDDLSRQLQPLVASSNDTVNALQTQILPEAHKMLTSLDDLSTSLSGVARKVDKDPSVIVRGAAPLALGPGERQ